MWSRTPSVWESIPRRAWNEVKKLTTREPDDSMIECAITALIPVLVADSVTVTSDVKPMPVARSLGDREPDARTPAPAPAAPV